MDVSSAHRSSVNLPDTDRLSVLAALVMLAYVLAQIIKLPVWLLSFTVLGSYFSITIDVQSLVGVLVAGLIASGADWLFHDHPGLAGRSSLPYVILPGLVALMINLGLGEIPFDLFWWMGLLGGSIVLVLVLVGEYISLYSTDVRQPFAIAVLTAVAFAAFLGIVTILRTAELRLYLMLPAVFGGSVLASLRILHLRLSGEWLFYEAVIIGFVVSHAAAALHYWPISPVAYGLLTLGVTFALNSLMIALIEEKKSGQAWVEPVIAITAAIIAAWIVR
jgi:hypothetical protein